MLWRWNDGYRQVQRMLVPRGSEHLSHLLSDHLRDAVVGIEFVLLPIAIPCRDPPEDAIFHTKPGGSQVVRWIADLLGSLTTTRINYVGVDGDLVNSWNFSVVLRAAHASHGVDTMKFRTFYRQLTILLHNPAFLTLTKAYIRTVSTCL